MTVTAIWRYPVKSMAGERLARATITAAGIVGDRVVQVCDRNGRLATARAFPRLLRLRATLGADREPLVDGRPWCSPEVAASVEAAVGPWARLQRFDGPERFDVLPLLVCTDGAVSMFGHDVRRLRPNLLIGGVDPAAERDWPGATLEMRDAAFSSLISIGCTNLQTREARGIFQRTLTLKSEYTAAGRVEVCRTDSAFSQDAGLR